MHVLESDNAEGRYIVSSSPNNNVMVKQIGESLRKALPDYPIPSVQLPLPVFKLFTMVDDRLDQAAYDRATACPFPGYDGSRLVEHLGFEYKYPDLDVRVF